NQPDVTTFTHEPTPLFPVALKGLEPGYRSCFDSIPIDLSRYHILCETYDFLNVDVLGGKPLREIYPGLKAGDKKWGTISEAQDEAFKFLYLLLLGELEDSNEVSRKVFEAVYFIVSRPCTFTWNTRQVVRMAHEERLVVSSKQRAVLDEWGEHGKVGEDPSDDYDFYSSFHLYMGSVDSKRFVRTWH
ncbi:hypothetical protein P280DRAFT_391245, partial [Massarina eburnea CBS 473.64]